MTPTRPWLCEDSAPAEQKAAQALFAVAWALEYGTLRFAEAPNRVADVFESVRKSEAGRR